MWQTKYALAIPKNLEVGVDFRPCSEGGFLTGCPLSVIHTSWSWSQPYSCQNSAKLSCKLEVTLVCMQSGMQPKTKKPIRLPFRCKLPRFSAAPHWAALASRLALAGLAWLGCPSCLQLFSSSIFIRICTVQCIVQSPSPNVLLFVMTFNPQPFSFIYL